MNQLFWSNLLGRAADHALSILVVVITSALLYHFLIDRRRGKKLAKKYRDSLYELQAKFFYQAVLQLIAGQREQAMAELLNAAELQQDHQEAYFALARLYRASGEHEKAIQLHRTMVARHNISESLRLEAMKELAIDFDKAGMLDQAIEAYKDVLKLNREQLDIIKNLCRILEDIGDWDQALNYRLLLSKMGPENQAETLSHILVEQSKVALAQGDLARSNEKLEEAFRYAPCVSANIQRVLLQLLANEMDSAQHWLFELVQEWPMSAGFVFSTLERFKSPLIDSAQYAERLIQLREAFLTQEYQDQEAAALVLTKVRIYQQTQRPEQALALLKGYQQSKGKFEGEVMRLEYLKLLAQTKQYDQLWPEFESFLGSLERASTKHFCSQCGYSSDDIFWRCPQCYQWETIQFRWKS